MIPPAATTMQPLADQIRAAVRSGSLTLPPLPEMATRLLGMLRDQDHTDLDSVGELLGRDPALAAAVLKLANSALFGGLRSVDSLSDASARLGLRQIATMVTTISHRGHFTTGDRERLGMLHALWDHAVASAVAARHLTALGGGDRAEAYLAGLLHDVGKLLVLKGVDEIDSRPGVPHVAAPVVDELMIALHCELGGRTLEDWKLPAVIVRVAKQHHEVGAADDDLLIVRVRAASAIARKLGLSLHPDPGLPLLKQPCIERLGLSDIDLAGLLVDVEDEVAQVKSML